MNVKRHIVSPTNTGNCGIHKNCFLVTRKQNKGLLNIRKSGCKQHDVSPFSKPAGNYYNPLFLFLPQKTLAND